MKNNHSVIIPGFYHHLSYPNCCLSQSTLVEVKQNLDSKINVADHSNKERESTSRLTNFSKVNHSVKEPSSSENLRHESHTASFTCTRSSVEEDQSNEGDNILHVIEMSPENDPFSNTVQFFLSSLLPMLLYSNRYRKLQGYLRQLLS